MKKYGICDCCHKEGNLIEYNGEYLAYAALKLKVGQSFCETCSEYFTDTFWNNVQYNVKPNDFHNFINQILLNANKYI